MIRVLMVVAMLALAAGGCAPGPDPLTAEQKLEVSLQTNRPLQLELLKCYQQIAELQGGEGRLTAEQKREQDRIFEALAEDPFKAVKIGLGGVTGGAAIDSKGFDDGIRILLQPQDKTGDLVKRAGAVELELYDLAAPAADQRLGHWEFTVNQAAKNWVSGVFGLSGYVFELKYPEGKPPEHAHLTLLARFTTLDGRPLSTQKDFDVKLPPAAKEPPPAKPAEKK